MMYHNRMTPVPSRPGVGVMVDPEFVRRAVVVTTIGRRC